MTSDLPADVIYRARTIFADNLLLAFVGGSRAIGTQRNDSDIDAFVLLGRSDRRAEVEFATELLALHATHELAFDHFGEIFDMATMSSLLAFTAAMSDTFPKIAQAPCYRGNCLLSIYRKGLVVFRFLADPKIEVYDLRGLLPDLERQAAAYLANRRDELPPRDAEVRLADGSSQRELLTRWKAGGDPSGLLDTPVGVELQRWFGPQLDNRLARLPGDRALAPTTPAESMSCPMILDAGIGWSGYAAQCLSVPPHMSSQ